MRYSSYIFLLILLNFNDIKAQIYDNNIEQFNKFEISYFDFVLDTLNYKAKSKIIIVKESINDLDTIYEINRYHNSYYIINDYHIKYNYCKVSKDTICCIYYGDTVTIKASFDGKIINEIYYNTKRNYFYNNGILDSTLIYVNNNLTERIKYSNDTIILEELYSKEYEEELMLTETFRYIKIDNGNSSIYYKYMKWNSRKKRDGSLELIENELNHKLIFRGKLFKRIKFYYSLIYNDKKRIITYQVVSHKELKEYFNVFYINNLIYSITYPYENITYKFYYLD